MRRKMIPLVMETEKQSIIREKKAKKGLASTYDGNEAILAEVAAFNAALAAARLGKRVICFTIN